MLAKRSYRLGIAALLIALLTTTIAIPPGASAGAPAAPGADLPWRDKGTPFGVVAAIGNRVRADEIDAYVGLLREAGVQWTREEISWDHVQRTPGGPYGWSGDGSGLYDYDHSVAAQRAAGIQVLGLLDYQPAWFAGQSVPLDQWIKEWGDYVYQTVAHFGRGGAIKHWEIWNEPNITHFGAGAGLRCFRALGLNGGVEAGLGHVGVALGG